MTIHKRSHEGAHSQAREGAADAADCDLICSLATDPKKRETFRQLAVDLRKMVADLDAVIAAQTQGQ